MLGCSSDDDDDGDGDEEDDDDEQDKGMGSAIRATTQGAVDGENTISFVPASKESSLGCMLS